MAIRPIVLPIGGMDDHDSVAIDDLYCANLRNVRSDRSRIIQSPGGELLCPVPTSYSATNGAGASQGTFQQPAATGSQVIPHSLGVTPVAILLTTAFHTAYVDGGREIFMWGATDGTTSFNLFQMGIHGSTGNVVGGWGNEFIELGQANIPNQTIHAAFTSWNAASFTINWTRIDPTFRATYTFVALGGAGTAAKVSTWTFPGTTGNKAVTGVGFIPDAVLMGAAPTAGLGRDGALANNNEPYSIGAMTASAQWVSSNVGSTATNQRFRQQSTTQVLLGMDYTSGATKAAAKYVSMDADGYTVNVTTANPEFGQWDWTVASIAFDGFSGVKVGSFTKPTTSAPVRASVTGVGFGPASVILVGDKNPASSTFATDHSITMGMGTLVAQAAASLFIDSGSNNTRYTYSTTSTYKTLNTAGTTVDEASLFAADLDGFTLNWTTNSMSADQILYLALAPISNPVTGQVGVIRNYGDLIVGGTTPTEKLVMLTSKSAFIYAPQTPSTGIWTPTSEMYTGTDVQRFSIANGTDSTYGAVAAWSQGKDNIRYYDGSTFGSLITSGTNHAARTLLPFNNRIVSVRPFVAGVDQKTQIRWCVNGDFADWFGTGSGTLEVVETSNQPLTGGCVIGGRCFLTRAREVVELIATGSLSPVFIPEPRVPGVGCIATHSIATGDIFAFWLGPDEIYQFDGSQVKAVGGRMYNTITQFVDYENLDLVQGVVYEPDSQYWFLVPPYVFVYDYRRDIWDWDDSRDFVALGRFTVADVFTADIDHSEFIVLGDAAVQTIRSDPSINTFLGASIDSYFETKDNLPLDQVGRQVGISYDKYNTVWRVWFRGTPGEVVECAVSNDKGLTYPPNYVQIVTVNAAGVGIFFSDVAWGVLRVRLRSQGGSEYSIQGGIMVEYTEAGQQLPP